MYHGSRPHGPMWKGLLDRVLDIPGFRLPFGDGETLDNKTLAKLLGGQSWAMHWFVSSIRREIGLEVAGKRDARRLIRSGVLARLRAVPGEDGLGLLKTYDTTFNVNCDLVSFFERKQYDGPPEEMLSRVITLSGNGNAVQAMTTLEYIQQVWPRHGLQLISSLEQMLSSNQAKGKTSGECCLVLVIRRARPLNIESLTFRCVAWGELDIRLYGRSLVECKGNRHGIFRCRGRRGARMALSVPSNVRQGHRTEGHH